MSTKRQKVTLPHMRVRLAESCQQQFHLLRHYHHEYLRARRSGDERKASYYSAIRLQAKFAAVTVYDLYLESRGFGYKRHMFKQNARDVRRFDRQHQEEY